MIWAADALPVAKGTSETSESNFPKGGAHLRNGGV